MTTDNPAEPAEARVEGILQPGGSAAAQGSNSWLLCRKVTIPDPIGNEVHRAGLVVAGMTRARITVLNAPAGFGKTALLAECFPRWAGFPARQRADGACIRHLALARRDLVGHRYANIFIDLEIAQTAMAQGRVADAEAHFERAHEALRTNEVGDAAPMLVARILRRELALECNRPVPVDVLARAPRRLLAAPTSFSAYAAAGGMAVDHKRRSEDVGSALAAVDEMPDYVLDAGLPALVRYLSALRVSLLATAGRVGDAERDWRLRGLPEDSRGCLDLTGQSWREMEALSCARLRILTARERFDEGRRFVADLCTEAAARGLRRTLMRALSLSMTLESRAGEPAAAVGHMEEFLRLFGETPYAWSLVREHEIAPPVVESLLDSIPDSPGRRTALSLLASELAPDELRPPALSDREQEILERIEAWPDKRIAVALGLSAHVVRHHLRNLFTKLGVHNRAEAVRRAKELRLIHEDTRTGDDTGVTKVSPHRCG